MGNRNAVIRWIYAKCACEWYATRNRDPGASTRATHAMPPNPRYLLICFEYFAFSIGSDFTISWATQCWRLLCTDSRRKQTTKTHKQTKTHTNRRTKLKCDSCFRYLLSGRMSSSRCNNKIILKWRKKCLYRMRQMSSFFFSFFFSTSSLRSRSFNWVHEHFLGDYLFMFAHCVHLLLALPSRTLTKTTPVLCLACSRSTFHYCQWA